MATSVGDRLVRTRIPNNVERGAQTASASFNIRDNKINVEWLLKQGLKLPPLPQHTHKEGREMGPTVYSPRRLADGHNHLHAKLQM